ncbi:hypothetical protein KUV80_07995 [Fictibacillus nanhaiensis]|uniref:hypothetical protein n=1 Tax=Fictibacillus nanhaiensis TaxID=742169 RepID=UPI001C94C3C4|nr:hypothetical protein [Fictibacillus nanhaiensis]MBY6036590.1 hypothetical protein [Fictibacillus nanhaiensis]
MRNIMVCLVTCLFLVGVNYGLAMFFKWQFIDFSLFVGLSTTLIIRYFTSTGGMSSNMVRMQAQAITGMKIEETKSTFKPTYAYYTAMIYTIVSLIAVLVYYKDYFL